MGQDWLPKPSERVSDQRLRNRLIECLEVFAMGDAGVREIGFAEYWCGFYDWVGHGEERHSFNLTTFTSDEEVAFSDLFSYLEYICERTPSLMADNDFIATGWPERIERKSTPILKLFLARGRFSETVEQAEPAPDE